MKFKKIIRLFIIGVILMLSTPFFAFSASLCENCDQEKYSCEQEALDNYIECLDHVAEESQELYNSLFETAKEQLDAAEEAATESRDYYVNDICSQIDNIIGRNSCIAGAYAAYSVATAAAYTAYGLAVTAITAEITAFEYAQFAGCVLVRDIELASCLSSYNQCVANQGDPGICKKCASNGTEIPDDSEDPGICKKCKNGKVKNDNSENPGTCKKCQGGSPVNDDTEPCDDGDVCTENDRCEGGACIGDDPLSPVNPNCQ